MKIHLLFLIYFFVLPCFLQAQIINLDFPSVNGQVYALDVKGDTLFIGGEFIEVAEIPRKNLAAIDLNTGNLLDWAPETDGKVDCISVYQNTVYICGTFQVVNGMPRNTLGAIDAEHGTLSNWNPDIVFPGIPNMQTGRISDIDTRNGIVYIGGYFLSVNGQNRSNLAAIDLPGNLQSWAPVFDTPLEKVKIRNDLLYVSGPFANVNGQERLSFASFDLNSGNLTEWNPKADNPGNSGTIVHPREDHVFIAGFFTNVDGTLREHAAKVDHTLGTLLPWEVSFFNALPFVTSFERWGNQLFMGGSFILHQNIPVGNLVSVDVETGEYNGWWADPNNTINALLVTNDKLIAGGNFTHISGQNKIGLAVFDLDQVNEIDDLELSGISLFPVPASDQLDIRFPSPWSGYLELYGLNGELVIQQEVKDRSAISLNLDEMDDAIYSLVFRSSGYRIIKTSLIPVIKH